MLLEPRNEIHGLGTRPIDCGSPGFDVAPVEVLNAVPEEKHILGLEGALQPCGDVYTKWGWDAEDVNIGNAEGIGNPLRVDLQDLLNLDRKDITQGSFTWKIDYAPPIDAMELKQLPTVTSIEITWHTLQPMTSKVQFWQEGEDIGIVSDQDLKTGHALTMRGLEPGAKYRFKVGGADDTGQNNETPEGEIEMPSLPCVTPPIYGQWHAAINKVDLNKRTWLHELNLDPRHRTAAGFAAEVVR